MPRSKPISALSITFLVIGLDRANFGPKLRILSRAWGTGVSARLCNLACPLSWEAEVGARWQVHRSGVDSGDEYFSRLGWIEGRDWKGKSFKCSLPGAAQSDISLINISYASNQSESSGSQDKPLSASYQSSGSSNEAQESCDEAHASNQSKSSGS